MTEEELKSIEGIGIEGNPGRIVRDLIAEVRRLQAMYETAVEIAQARGIAACDLTKENHSLRDLLREVQGVLTPLIGGFSKDDKRRKAGVEIATNINAALGEVNKATCPPHSWTASDGEKCSKCGMKDWMTG